MISALAVQNSYYNTYQLVATGTTWSASLAVAAQSYALIAAYDFIKACRNLYNYRPQNSHTDTNPNNAEPYSDVLFQGLKLTGLVLLGFGPACFLAGFSFLAAAALVGLYKHNEFIRKNVNAAGENMVKGGLATISLFAHQLARLPGLSSLETPASTARPSQS